MKLQLLLFGTLSLLAVCFVASSDATEGVHWALLVAGSRTWNNYRHQADICHAYQILRKNGIAEERIVTMMYDDIAHNELNPTPGIIINHPNGPDVYAGVKIDYKGDDVTPKTFLAALLGKEDELRGIGSGKVIKSGPNDNVFVYYADHGNVGLVAFPDEEVLYAKKLQDAIISMHDNKKYAQMVFYVEACMSGSMFDGLLPDNIKVWATTASLPDESSYGCYWDDKRQTLLGDWYSVNWMEDSDAKNLSVHTLWDQFRVVRQETNTSHVQQYGEKDISKQPVNYFQGTGSANNVEPFIVPAVERDPVPSGHVPLFILSHQFISASHDAERISIRYKMFELLQTYHEIDDTMKAIVFLATEMDSEKTLEVIEGGKARLTDHECYKTSVELYRQLCHNRHSRSEYALSQLYMFANLCEERISVQTIQQSIDEVCNAAA